MTRPVRSGTIQRHCIETATNIAIRITDEAMWHGDACTWMVTSHDAERGRDAFKIVPASESLYQGASGIALFLAEIWGVTGDRRMVECASGALRHCATGKPRRRANLALHSGQVGVALVAARLAQLTQNDEWRDFAISALAGITPETIRTDQGFDVIAGSGGAILGLLRIARMAEIPLCSDLARCCGEHLVRTARRAPAGWSWMSGIGAEQDLTGYAHGASGIAHAFMELYAADGDSQWAFAASRAMSYERHHEGARTTGWPDFRNNEVTRAIMSGGPASLRAQLLNGGAARILDRTPARTTAWCHGAPGIALPRARALSLDLEVEYVRRELDRALRATRDSLPSEVARGYSLCHGVFGNAETLLVANEQLDLGDLYAVESVLTTALEKYGDNETQWPTGVIGGGHDPSLLVGEAGIGHFLLRFSRPEIPSVLCLSDWNRPPANATSFSRHIEAEAAHLMPTLGKATQHFAGVSAARDLIKVLSSSTNECDAVIRAIRAAIDKDETDAGTMLRDALAVDARVLDHQSGFDNFVSHYCYSLMRPESDEIDWEHVHIGLAPHAEVVRTSWAWSAWNPDNASAPEEHMEAVVVFRSGQVISREPLNDLHGLIVEALSPPDSLSGIVSRVVNLIESDPEIAVQLPGYIRSFVCLAVEKGFADVIAAEKAEVVATSAS